METQPTKEIIILAMGGTRDQCDYKGEVWSVNMGYKQIAALSQHVEKIFIGHGQVKESDTGRDMFDWEEINSLIAAGCEVFNIHKVKGLNARVYPLKAVIEKLDDDYFSSTICYMLAWAIYKYTVKDKETGRLTLTQPVHLRLYGVDMAQKLPDGTGEYTLEKGGVEHWVGYARGLGMKVTIAEGGEVLRTYNRRLYGTNIVKSKCDPFHLLGRKTLLPRKESMLRAKRLIPKTSQFTEEYKGND